MSHAVTAEYDNGEVVQLGKYRLLALIARGGMGDIYLAMAEGPARFRKLVVVKVLRTDAEEEEAYRSMFLDEGMLAARLSHPNVVQTHEVGENAGQLYIAMEYLEGQPLSRLMRAAGRMPGPLSARIVADALTGLEYAHELRDFDGSPLDIVHRDLSPQNVFVTYDGVVKVVDFGIAKAALTSRALTEVGVLKGKISYMAPEYANGSRVDRRADVFAMGIVLWELVTGRRLFDPRYTSQCLKALLDPEPFARLSVIHADSDPHLEAIVARALEKNPANRYQSAGEMRADLEACLARAAPSVRTPHIAAFLLQHFAQHRERMQEQVRACVAGVAPVSERRLPAIGVRSRSTTDSSGMTHQKLESGRVTSGDIHCTSSASLPSPGTVRRWPWLPASRMPTSARARLVLVGGVLVAAAIVVVIGAARSPGGAEAGARASVSVGANVPATSAPPAASLTAKPLDPIDLDVRPAVAALPRTASAAFPPARQPRPPGRAEVRVSAPLRASAIPRNEPSSAERAPAPVAAPGAAPANGRVDLVDDGHRVELVE